MPFARLIRWMALCHALFLFALVVFDFGAGLPMLRLSLKPIRPQEHPGPARLRSRAPVFLETDKDSRTRCSPPDIRLQSVFRVPGTEAEPGPSTGNF